jgi:cell division septation protein DedD
VAESHEPSYYEIALTNRQVVVAFVVLLICVMGAFFSGVWIGREGSVRAAQEQMVRNTPPDAAKEGKNLEELEFFDKSKKTADPTKTDPQEAAHPSVGSTLLEDLGVKKKPAAQAPPLPPPAAVPAPRPATPASPAPVAAAAPDPAQARRDRKAAAAATAAQDAQDSAEETPAAPPVAAKTTAKTAAKPAKTAKTTTTASAKGSFVIQVFSSADQAQAERISARLVAGGQTAYLSPIDRGGRTMYRVRVGPFKTRDEAQKVADKVRKGYKLDTWVTE